ncbi:MAG: hypothetical protein GY737_17120 [Desulfobacteraceae bacterium]|nr:hypothetical protein [Desulfobacteraceae bacterium]
MNGCSLFAINIIAERLNRRYTAPSPIGRTELSLDFKEPIKKRLFVMVAGVFADSISIDNQSMLGLSFLPGNF